MKKVILLLISALAMHSCSKDEEFFEDNSLCICEKYFNEYYDDYLIPSYQIKSLTIKDWHDPIDKTEQLLVTVTFYNEVPMSKVTSTVKDAADKYGKETNDIISQWQSNGEKGLQITCKHLWKKKYFNNFVKN